MNLKSDRISKYEYKTGMQKDTCTQRITAEIFMVAQNWKLVKCSSMAEEKNKI